MSYIASSGVVHTPPQRTSKGSLLYVEDFSAVMPGVWNDGLGTASRDCDIMFNGKPTLRLDPQGQVNSGATSPGRTAATSGVVVKRRIHDGYRGRFGVEAWFRMSSLNLTSNAFFSMSIYNRNGTNAHHARIWFDPNGNNQPMIAKLLDGAATSAAGGTATWTTAVTSVVQNGAGSHTFEPKSGRLDRAGGWHWAKLVVDFRTLKYVSLQFDGESVTDLSAYDMDVSSSAGFAGMHHSFEFSASSATSPRFVNVANMVGTAE